VLSRLRNRPNFGNIGEVENLLSKAKIRYQKRQSSLPLEQRSPDAPFEPRDFDPEFDRGKNATANLGKLFEDVVGCDEIIEKLRGYQQAAETAKMLGKDPRDLIPTNFVFKGPPGVYPEEVTFSTWLIICDQLQAREKQRLLVKLVRYTMTWASFLLRRSSSALHLTWLDNMLDR
jgi:hypothetical protein